jgi:putative two-component system hydrogenase maturation factor HypX/HoxX
MENRLPIGTLSAKRAGLVDDSLGMNVDEFVSKVESIAEALASDTSYAAQLKAKRQQQAHDEAIKPLSVYRAEELERMKLNFYGFDPSYHVARYNFVFKISHSWTPLHLAKHRRRVKDDYRFGDNARNRAGVAASAPVPTA